MSDKNKIAIIFEALGIDKVVGSLKNLTSNFSKANKDIDSKVKCGIFGTNDLSLKRFSAVSIFSLAHACRPSVACSEYP